LIKRFLVVCFILCFVFCGSVCATEDKYLPVIPEDFYLIEENADEIASLLNMTTDKLKNFCIENNIFALAVSKDAKKEIRLQIEETDFSKKVFDFKNYSDNELYTLSLDIIGFDGVTGKIVENGGQRFIKTEIASLDKDGYSVLQYITIAKGKYYVLSFYCDNDSDFTFASEVFNNFYPPDFMRVSANNTEAFEIIIPICIGLLSAVIIVTVGYLVVVIKKRKQ